MRRSSSHKKGHGGHYNKKKKQLGEVKREPERRSNERQRGLEREEWPSFKTAGARGRRGKQSH